MDGQRSFLYDIISGTGRPSAVGGSIKRWMYCGSVGAGFRCDVGTYIYMRLPKRRLIDVDRR